MASATPVTYAQAPASPRFPHTESSSASKASRVASDRLGSPASPSFYHLEGDEPQTYNFTEKLTEAYQLLRSEEHAEAAELFGEILSTHRSNGAGGNLIIAAHCHIGIAYCHPDNSHQRNLAVSDALKILHSVFDNRLNQGWDRLEPQERSSAFLELRSCYELALMLLPEETKVNSDIQGVIKECSKFILPLDEFNQKVREAGRCAARMEPAKARNLYDEALEIRLENTHLCTIAAATCFLNYASTYSDKSRRRAYFLAQARTKLDELYANKEFVFVHLNWTREKFFATLGDLYTKLEALMPKDDSNTILIRHRIEFCEANNPKPNTEESGFSGLERRRVSPGFRSRSNRFVFLARVIILGLAAVGAISLFRRFVIRIG